METEMTTNPDATTPDAAQSAPRYDELKRMVADMEADFVRFYSQGNKAAGTRVRAAMQELKNFAQTVRTEVQAIKNEGKPASASSDDAS
jgi:hypothetical protein